MSYKKSALLAVFVLLMLAMSACTVVKSAAGEHDKLVDMYFQATTSKSTFGACVDSATAKINLIQGTYESYLNTEEARVDAWRQNINDQTGELNDKLQDFRSFTPNEQGAVDLNAMVNQGATPADVAEGFALTIQAYAPTEAVLPVLPTEVVTRVLDEQAEATNFMFSCVVDWNQAAQAYNAERAKINGLTNSGRIIGDAAQALGVTELPNRLPLYESASSNRPIPSFGGE